MTLFVISTFSFGQTTSILTFKSDDLNAASTAVKNDVGKVTSGGFYNFVGFYSVADLATVQNNGDLLLTFHHDSIPDTNFVFTAKDVTYSTDEYYWYGEYFDTGEGDQMLPSFIHISKFEEDEYVFTIKLDGRSFKGVTLDDGSLGVFQYFGNPNRCDTCQHDTITSDTIINGVIDYTAMKNCNPICKVDILFLYTSEAEDGTVNIENEIVESMRATKTLMNNSGVSSCKTNFDIVRMEPNFSFPSSQYVTIPINMPNETVINLSYDYTAKSLRSQYNADIVILIDDNKINTLHNLSQGYFGNDVLNKSVMYAIIGVDNLASGDYSLAHQLGHLFSARHFYNSYINSPGSYNGYKDVKGVWPIHFSTIMYPQHTFWKSANIPYFSNEFLEFNNQPLGTSNESAAFAFINESCVVANMVSDPNPLPFAVYITEDKYACPCMNTTVDVTVVNAPNGTVSYEWFSSSDGINYVSAGNSPNQIIQAPCLVGNVIHVKVKVTAGNFSAESIATIKAQNSVGGIPCAMKKEPTAITEIGVNNGYSIFPNPAKNTITIKSEGGIHTGETIAIFSIDGKLLLSNKVAAYNNEIQLNISTIKSGNYIVEITNLNQEKTTIQFIKTK